MKNKGIYFIAEMFWWPMSWEIMGSELPTKTAEKNNTMLCMRAMFYDRQDSVNHLSCEFMA